MQVHSCLAAVGSQRPLCSSSEFLSSMSQGCYFGALLAEWHKVRGGYKNILHSVIPKCSSSELFTVGNTPLCTFSETLLQAFSPPQHSLDIPSFLPLSLRPSLSAERTAVYSHWRARAWDFLPCNLTNCVQVLFERWRKMWWENQRRKE